MNKKDKDLLIKDLSARFPYGLKVQIQKLDEDKIIDNEDFGYMWLGMVLFNNPYHQVKPYLRPMSSMTEEEETLFRCELPAIAKTDAQLVAMRMELFLKGHLDFNHLIEKGLALEAPKDMYKTE